MDKLLKDLKYIDGITIVDTKGTILLSTQLSADLYQQRAWEYAVGKNIFEAYIGLDDEGSSLMEAMEYDVIVQRDRQRIEDMFGQVEETMNISIPIKSLGKIVGAIELSRSLHTPQHADHDVIEMNVEFIQRHSADQIFKSNEARYTLDDIIAVSAPMIELKEQIVAFKDGSLPVFIYGETGTGKELFAHAIHNSSSRKDGPFVAINCAAIPDKLMESILFGTEKGSFTGALDAKGIFHEAHTGTIYLDEINSLPLHLQPKLLRVLEDGCVRRVGSTKEEYVDVRVLSSSNVPIIECLEQGLLRTDIYYRLCTFNINIPPLRKRKEDILPLVEHFIANKNKTLSKNIRLLSRKAYDRLMGLEWEGNVRQLKHLIDTAMVFVSKDQHILDLDDMESFLKDFIPTTIEDNLLGMKSLPDMLIQHEVEYIIRALDECNHNYTRAAKLLGIPRQTLNSKMLKYGLK